MNFGIHKMSLEDLRVRSCQDHVVCNVRMYGSLVPCGSSSPCYINMYGSWGTQCMDLWANISDILYIDFCI